jgi:hypothetical protein
MKAILAALFLSIATPIMADEIRFETAPWDSLAIPLGINAYYLHIDSPAVAKSARVEMDLYVKGKFVRTIVLTDSSFEKPQSVQLKVAIYFKPSQADEIPGVSVMTWGQTTTVGHFEMTKSEWPLDRGAMGCSGRAGKIISPDRTPVFWILAGGVGGVTSDGPIPDFIKANPEASILVGYLKTE